MTNTIGRKILEFRKKSGISQQDVADYCGIPRELISYYETGEREVSVLNLEKISQFMNVDMEVFFAEDPDGYKPDLALTFRANELSAEDRKAIAYFKEIVKNYLKMKRIEGNGTQT